MRTLIETIRVEGGELSIIDQTQLPSRLERLVLKDEKDVFEAIRRLVVRGAPAIGICAAYGVAVGIARVESGLSRDLVKNKAWQICDYLAKSRPTAVNLFFALDRCRTVIGDWKEGELSKHLFAMAKAMHESDLDTSEKMASLAGKILDKDSRVLTHCNAGALATGGGGTALGLITRGHRQGLVRQVWVDETRPLLQGARLTAWELGQTGVPYQLICDNMAAAFMASGEVDVVIVGADRITRNGDFANKIGTYGLAVLADYHGIPFYTVAPCSTFDRDSVSGQEIVVEERSAEEVRGFGGRITAPAGAPVRNPAFDVTPAELVSGIVCEKGVLRPPFTESINNVFGDN